MSKWVLRTWVFASIIPLSLLSDEVSSRSNLKKTSPPTEKICNEGPRPMRVTARHIEPNGIGYNQGYTTLEGFFSSSKPWGDGWFPFLDLRGHAFNSGKLAANAGVGVRYLLGSRIWGGNVYYDFRNTKHQHYNQVALGFEALGEVWDYRINGYLPVGNKTSPFYNTQFSHFKGNSAFLSRMYQFAMKGINAEAAAHVDCFKNAPIYFAAGPYYLGGQGKSAWGGQFRAAVDLYNYVRIEGNTSYDNVFKWIGQGQLSVMVPFGPKKMAKESSRCQTDMALASRLYQRVDRNEIIPIDTKHQETPAINPLTGEPYTFWFVDNTSHSAGTFESPFSTLTAAESASSSADVIYVFPGDGSALTGGITLKNDQQLLGASINNVIPTTLGDISIPPFASSMPLLTSAENTFVVTVVNNNTVSGLNIEVPTGTSFASAVGIGTNDNITNFTGIQNTISGSSGFDNLNIYFGGNADQIVLTGNTFNMNDAGVGVYTDGTAINSLASSYNTFYGGDASYGIFSECDSTTLLSSTNDLFGATTLNAYGIYNDTPITTLNVTNCTFNVGYGLYVDAAIDTVNSMGNTFNFNDYYGMYILDPISNFQSVNDVFVGTDYSIYWDTSSGNTTGSLINDYFSGCYTYIAVPADSTYTWTITGNVFTEASEAIEISMGAVSSATCVLFDQNSAPSASDLLADFNNTVGGTFTWLSPANNFGMTQTTGPITMNATSCP